MSGSTCAEFVVDCGEDRDREYGDSPTLDVKKRKKSQALAARRKVSQNDNDFALVYEILI